MPNRFAVIGHPVSHTLSPKIHQLFAQQFDIKLQYQPLLGDLEQFELQVSNFFAQGGKGLNVTLPFKERAFALATVVTPRASKAQAANTLWMDQGHLHADNTDGIGFIRDIHRYIELKEQSVLLLGAGGAARGIIGPILDCEPKVLVVFNRTPQKLSALQQDFPKIKFEVNSKESFDVVINATSSSLSEGAFRFPEFKIRQNALHYDLAYQLHHPTPFVNEIRQSGGWAIDGLGMLIEQAAEAFYLWHDLRPDTASLPEKLLHDRS